MLDPLQPLRELVAPGKRTHWAFLALGAVLALAVWLARARRVPLRRFFFAREQWLHRSALADYGFVPLRALLAAALWAPLAFSTLAIAAPVRSALVAIAGSPAREASFAVALAYSLVAFVADDLSRYLVHRAMHRVPALWHIHQVHHSAEVLTPATLLRVHPIEVVLHQLRGRLVLGVVAGVFTWLAPGTTVVEVFGVELMVLSWNALGANLRHSQVWLSFGPALEHVLVSPAQHQLHHSVDPAHRDKNFGSALAIWDWCAGTLVVARRRLRLRFGVAGGANHGHAPLGMLWRPVVASARSVFAVAVRRGRDVLRPRGSLARGPGDHRPGDPRAGDGDHGDRHGDGQDHAAAAALAQRGIVVERALGKVHEGYVGFASGRVNPRGAP